MLSAASTSRARLRNQDARDFSGGMGRGSRATPFHTFETRSTSAAVELARAPDHGSPKATMTLGPFYRTELFVGWGMGMHSNDASRWRRG